MRPNNSQLRKKETGSERISRLVQKILINLVLIIGAAFMLTPLLWMLT